jgi:ABC-type lipoprotein release transport system permease subunit
MPEAADEIMLGADTADVLGKAVGDRIELTGSAGTATYRVTGTGFLPVGSHNGYTDGAWVTDAGYDAVLSGFKFRQILVSASGGAPLAALQRDLPDLGFEAPDTAGTVAQLKEVRRLPLLLGGFLALLAVGAVGHALVTAVRRRALDIAVLRAVGLTPGQSRWLVVVQATVVVLVGLAFGVPLGLAVGRTVWRVVADFTPVAYVAPTASLVLALIAPVALATAYVIATWPAVRASRIRVAHVLRAE